MKIKIKKELSGITIGAQYWGIVGDYDKMRVVPMTLENLNWSEEIFEFYTKNFTEVYTTANGCERLVFENEEEAQIRLEELKKTNERGLLEY